MARGISRLLGLELPRNFRFPYAATSPSDFWQRWHMSLSRWLRDYLYIPLGGNRHGKANTYRNLMITMALGGLWHGAAWHFLLWGVLHGVFMSINHLLRGRIRNPGFALRGLGWFATMVAVFGAWVVFRASTLTQALDVFKALGRPLDLSGATALFSSPTVATVLAVLLALLLAQVLAVRCTAPFVRFWREHRVVRPATFAIGSLVCWTAADVLSRSTAIPFIYFHF
jgi:D-alanyl-lipoteichoic acid acyltransferase DltB (MBOAT superfamily)